MGDLLAAALFAYFFAVALLATALFAALLLIVLLFTEFLLAGFLVIVRCPGALLCEAFRAIVRFATVGVVFLTNDFLDRFRVVVGGGVGFFFAVTELSREAVFGVALWEVFWYASASSIGKRGIAASRASA